MKKINKQSKSKNLSVRQTELNSKMCHSNYSMSLVELSILLVSATLLIGATLGGVSASGTRQFHLFGKTFTTSVDDDYTWPAPAAQGQTTGGEPIQLSREQLLIEKKKKLYLDSKCVVDLTRELAGADYEEGSSTGEVIKYLSILRCDLKPLIKMFSVLLKSLQPAASTGGGDHDPGVVVANLMSSPIEDELRREYSNFYQSVDEYTREAMFMLSQRDFCTFTTIARFSKLAHLTRDSKLLKLLNDLVITDYHSSCLMSTIEKLPGVPYVVKDVVKIYIDGVEDTRKPDLNDPSYLEMDAGFDIDEAIRREGSIDQVASLMLTIPSRVQGGSLKDLFRSECRELLMKLEQQWQPMEMMNQMLATESNTILQLNNLIMHSIIPQKYAQICSQLIVKA